MRWNFLAYVHGLVKTLRERWIFNQRNLVVDRDLADTKCDIVLSFGYNQGRHHGVWLIAQGHGIVGWIHDDGGGFGNLLHHAFARLVALDASHTLFDLRVSFCFLVLVFEFLLAHTEIGAIAALLSQ